MAVGYRTVPVPGPDPDHVPSKDRANLVDPAHVIVDPSAVNPTGTRRTVSTVVSNRRLAVVVNRSVIDMTVRTMAMKTDVEAETVVAAVATPAGVAREPVEVVLAARRTEVSPEVDHLRRWLIVGKWQDPNRRLRRRRRQRLLCQLPRWITLPVLNQGL